MKSAALLPPLDGFTKRNIEYVGFNAMFDEFRNPLTNKNSSFLTKLTNLWGLMSFDLSFFLRGNHLHQENHSLELNL